MAPSQERPWREPRRHWAILSGQDLARKKPAFFLREGWGGNGVGESWFQEPTESFCAVSGPWGEVKVRSTDDFLPLPPACSPHPRTPRFFSSHTLFFRRIWGWVVGGAQRGELLDWIIVNCLGPGCGESMQAASALPPSRRVALRTLGAALGLSLPICKRGSRGGGWSSLRPCSAGLQRRRL